MAVNRLRSTRALCALLVLTWPGAARTGSTPEPLPLAEQAGTGRSAAAARDVPFVDITAATGLDFTHLNGATGALLLPEVIGAGGALFDYDNDGDLDVFAVQGSDLGSASASASARPGSRLFRNDRGGGGLRFTDVTGQSGIVVTGYGMGAAAADFDNDGWIDLYVTSLGSNTLLRNNGDGSFSDVTRRTGTDDPRWSTSASFFDYDRDGWLDLFVANYVDFRADLRRACFSAASARDYCHPGVYDPVTDRLFRNNGDGTFSDVSVRAGITRTAGRGLGVLAADLNDDGWIDLYVANDGDPNHLWLNDSGSGAFTEDALLAGLAVSRAGRAQGSMGVDAADVDGDGDEDVIVTNLDNEANTFYLNLGKGLFEDRTVERGLFKLGFTGFGTRFLDYDHDGWLDLLVVNGAVRHLPAQAQRGDPYPLKQRNQLFRNDGGRRFVDVSDSSGAAFQPTHVARGAATGDLDNDGDTDIVIFNNSGRLRVLRNDAANGRRWLGVRVVDGRVRRDALQARVVLVRDRGPGVVRRVQSDGSYCVSSDPRILFGLAADASAQTLRVHWSPGDVEEFRGVAPDRYTVLERGKGRTP